jgi:pimeloyl-ACP methyl ester carboxylesterase
MTTTAPSTEPSTTRFATSADGTRIAYEVTGSGPALVLVDGALCHRSMGHARPLAARLSPSFTVHAYDRRGRGESGQGETSYDAEREVEDLAAVIAVAEGHAHVFAASSGVALTLAAAARGVPIDRIVAYEAPFIVDDTRAPNDPELPARLRALVDAGDRGGAVTLFLRTVGAPAPMVAVMRVLPVWKKLTAVAHTLPYDLSLVIAHEQGRPLPEGLYDAVPQPTLVIAGGKSPAYLQNAQAALAGALPDGHLETLPRQTHMIKAKVTAPVVASHLLANPTL